MSLLRARRRSEEGRGGEDGRNDTEGGKRQLGMIGYRIGIGRQVRELGSGKGDLQDAEALAVVAEGVVRAACGVRRDHGVVVRHECVHSSKRSARARSVA